MVLIVCDSFVMLRLMSTNTISYASRSNEGDVRRQTPGKFVGTASTVPIITATSKNKDTGRIVIAEVCDNIKAAADRFSHGVRKSKDSTDVDTTVARPV